MYAVGIAAIYLCKLYCGKFLTNRDEDFRRKVCIFFSFSVLFLIGALRGVGVGIDTRNYVWKYYMIRRHSFLDILTSLYCERVEIGYALLNKFVGLIFADARAIIVCNSFIVCFGMANFVYRYTKSDSTAILLFVCNSMFLSSLNITRQMMACVLLLNAWGALTKKQYRLSFALFVIGVSFHVTSVIYVVVYFFYLIRKNKKLVAATFGISLLFMLGYEGILRIISNVIGSFSYLIDAENTTSAKGIWALWVIELYISAFFVVSYFKSKRMCIQPVRTESPIDTANLICVPIFSVYYIILSYMGTRFSYLNRVGTFFLPFTIILFLNFEKVVKAKVPQWHRLYVVGLHVCYIAYFLLTARSAQYQYSFFWQ